MNPVDELHEMEDEPVEEEGVCRQCVLNDAID
jgi:hypothetical protein